MEMDAVIEDVSMATFPIFETIAARIVGQDRILRAGSQPAPAGLRSDGDS
jgi:hypothetical protein